MGDAMCQLMHVRIMDEGEKTPHHLQLDSGTSSTFGRSEQLSLVEPLLYLWLSNEVVPSLILFRLFDFFEIDMAISQMFSSGWKMLGLYWLTAGAAIMLRRSTRVAD